MHKYYGNKSILPFNKIMNNLENLNEFHLNFVSLHVNIIINAHTHIHHKDVNAN